MSHTAYTMPEPKHRTVKKRVQPVASIRTSEFAQEVKAIQPQKKAPGTNIHLVPAKVKTVAPRKSAIKLISFWPVAVGLFLCGFAQEWHAIAAQAGIVILRLTFPFALLATHREIGLDAQIAGSLPQFAIFAQLPLDGLMMTLALVRGKGLKAAIFQVQSVHLVCAFVLWLLTYLG